MFAYPRKTQRGHLAAHPALRTQHRSAQVPAEHDGLRADVERAFEPGAAPDLRPFVHHDRAAAGVEHDARLDERPEDHHLRRFADDDGPARNLVPAGREVVGAVHGQEVLERGEQVVGAVEHQSVHLLSVAVVVRPLPALPLVHDPGDGGALVGQPARPRVELERLARRGEPARGDDAGAGDRRERLHRRLGALEEPEAVVAEDGGGLRVEDPFPPLADAPDPGAQLGHRADAGERRPGRPRVDRLEEVQRPVRHRGPRGVGCRAPP